MKMVMRKAMIEKVARRSSALRARQAVVRGFGDRFCQPLDQNRNVETHSPCRRAPCLIFSDGPLPRVGGTCASPPKSLSLNRCALICRESGEHGVNIFLNAIHAFLSCVVASKSVSPDQRFRASAPVGQRLIPGDDQLDRDQDNKMMISSRKDRLVPMMSVRISAVSAMTASYATRRPRAPSARIRLPAAHEPIQIGTIPRPHQVFPRPRRGRKRGAGPQGIADMFGWCGGQRRRGPFGQLPARGSTRSKTE